MSGITLEVAQARLNDYLKAEEMALINQSYDIAGQKLTRADLAQIQQGIKTWHLRCKELALELQAGGGGSRFGSLALRD